MLSKDLPMLLLREVPLPSQLQVEERVGKADPSGRRQRVDAKSSSFLEPAFKQLPGKNTYLCCISYLVRLQIPPQGKHQWYGAGY